MNFDIIGAGPYTKNFLEQQAEFYKQNGNNAAADRLLNDSLYQSLANDPNVINQIEAKDNVQSWANNALTGDRDFARQVALQQMQQDFNSAEAALAYKRQVNTARNSTLWQAEQLRQLGVNPAWAIAGGGGSNATVSTAPTATSQAGNASPSGQQATPTLNAFAQLVVTAARLALLKK